MKVFSKIAFILMVSLIVFSASYILKVNGQSSGLNIDVSASVTNRGVKEDTVYTLIITNNGNTNIGSANISAFDIYNIRNLVVKPSNWNITNQEIQAFGSFILLTGPDQGLTPSQNLTISFDAQNPQSAGSYQWNIGISQKSSPDGLASPEKWMIFSKPNLIIVSLLPALTILGIAAGIAFLNSGLNRILINHFVGWDQYHVMQKEMNEHRAETMAAMRANDKKQIEKLKKKDSQVKNMQAKMLKPQMVQFGISFVYLLVWFVVLTPTFGNMSMAYLPGFGPISVFWLYPIFSFFLGLLSSRIIGIMPIEPR